MRRDARLSSIGSSHTVSIKPILFYAFVVFLAMLNIHNADTKLEIVVHTFFFTVAAFALLSAIHKA